jgi:hypothetical protein
MIPKTASGRFASYFDLQRDKLSRILVAADTHKLPAVMPTEQEKLACKLPKKLMLRLQWPGCRTAASRSSAVALGSFYSRNFAWHQC